MTHRILIILAALFWYTGASILLLKGGSLAIQAGQLAPASAWPWMAAISGLLLGLIKAKYIFSGSCRRNLARIYILKRPRWWQFFRPGFFVFLLLMIIVGATLSRMAQGNFAFLIGVALLDFTIAFALLGSSHVFWKTKYRGGE